MSETQTLPITCPNCGTQFQTPVRTLIDVGANPALRQAFLANQINVAVCPNCKQGGLLELPLVYHDAGAEFLAVYFPAQLNIPELERQKMIGEMTQTLMQSLPPDQRKGYFLSPRQFMDRQNLMDAVLGTMGISQEELDRQRRKARLLEQLQVFAEDPKGLQMMLKGKDDDIDYEFFLMLKAMLDEREAVGDEKAAQQLTNLRENLLKLTTVGKRIGKQEAAIGSLADIESPEQFFQKILASDMDEVDAIVSAARPALDYEFFQRLTERIDAGSGAEKDRLTRLRDHLLDLTEKMDAATQAELAQVSNLLRDLLSSPSPRSAVREHLDEIDDVFLHVLTLNMQEAKRQGATEVLERMGMIYDEVIQAAEAELPPEVRLVNDLLRSSYPEGTQAMLQERRAEVTPEVLDLMDGLAEELGTRDDESASATIKRLRDIKAQATLLV